MSLFTAALDCMTNKQFGENGHVEYAPVVTDRNVNPTIAVIKEQIVQFQFQCVRCNDDALDKLADQLRDILESLRKFHYDDSLDSSSSDFKQCFAILYKLIGQTRDIDSGKGERQLSYMMVYVWSEFYLDLAMFAVLCFVSLGKALSTLNSEDEKSSVMPYGSWKDMKRLCQYVYEKTNNSKHPLISYCIELIIDQLRIDVAQTDDSALSLCSRWVPRESSTKGRWQFRLLAESYFPEFTASALRIKSQEIRETSYAAAKKKTFMTFARMVSAMNKRLDTVQIKMCGKQWAEIDHHKTTSVSLIKSRNAFMNKSKKNGESGEMDRIICARNFEKYIESRVKEGKEVKGKRVGIVDYVKHGLQLYCSRSQDLEKDIVNAQWQSFMTQVGDLGNMVAMVDQSGSMSGDPMYAAMGMGIAVASRSALGKRVMTFSTEPEWVSLDGYGCDTFISSIEKLQKVSSKSGLGTNFFKALQLILDACIRSKLPNEVVSNMTLAIFSDMQIDSYTNTPYVSNMPGSFEDRMCSMHERIRAMYSAAGYSGVPHILFWNLRHTNGFPTRSTMKNATMFSGFSPMLLNAFCKKGVEALQQTSPWDALVESLRNERYDLLENKLGRI